MTIALTASMRSPCSTPASCVYSRGCPDHRRKSKRVDRAMQRPVGQRSYESTRLGRSAGCKERQEGREGPADPGAQAPARRPGRHLRPRRRLRGSIRPTARTTSSRSPPAACGRRPTPAPPGRRSSTTKGRTPSAASCSTRRTRTSSGSAPARTTASAASATATASTSRTDGGKTWKNVGLKTVRAHRQDPHRPARLGHGLRRRPGAAVGAGRRPRAVQDHRRRQDLEQGPQHQREHRRHRRRARPAEPGRARRRELPAPPARLDAHQRRPGQRDPPQHRRRQDVEEDHGGPARRRPRPHRPGDRPDRPGHGLRHRRGGRQARAASSAAPTAA